MKAYLQLLPLTLLALTNPAKAQIVPDSSVGTIVAPSEINNIINGGAIHGNNLFHSFSEFNIDAVRGVYFTNPTDITNIFTRVTGANPTNINGTLGVLGNANLFLMNPNGIVFGTGAKLDVKGSFLGTTASSINFADGKQFSVGTPQNTSLLTVSVPVGLGFGSKIGAIVNRSTVGLTVPNNRSLLLVGGDVSLEGGKLQAFGGRIELAGVTSQFDLGLKVDGNNLQLSVPNTAPLANVSLNNGALASVIAPKGGTIVVNAQNVNLTQGVLQGGVSGAGSSSTQAGNIEINAPGTISLNTGGISNPVTAGSTGNTGNININTGSLSLTNGSYLSALSRGNGNAGSININATNAVSFDGVDKVGNPSLASAAVIGSAVGNAGNINITTGSLSVTNGGFLSAASLARGNSGNIDIKANSILFDGFTPSGSASFAYTGKNPGGAGNAGNLNISTDSLSLRNGAYLSASTLARGNAGDVNIKANTVNIDGVGKNGYSTFISSAVTETGQGNSGNVNITSDSVSVTNGAFVSASTLGQGNAGNVNINANTVTLDGVASNGTPSFATSAVNPKATGNGGEVNITASVLSVTNGARITTITAQQGKGGNINVNADTLNVLGGGQILSTSASSGRAGDITLNIADSINLAGSYTNPKPIDENVAITAGPNSGIFANTLKYATGQGGDLRINSGQLFIRDNAQVSVSNQGTGKAGELLINAQSVQLNTKGSVTATSANGQGGNIRLQAQNLQLLGNSQINATAGTENKPGDGGNITINADTIVQLANSDITANAFEGNGGRIDINTQGIFRSLDSDIQASSQLGIDGVVNITTPDIKQDNSLAPQSSEFVNAEQVIASSCIARRNVNQGTFVITGTGGLQDSPSNNFDLDYAVVSVRAIGKLTMQPFNTNVTWSRGAEIKEATQLITTSDGRLLLTAYPKGQIASTQDLTCS